MKKAVKISIVLWLSIGMLVSCSKKDDDVVINDPTGQGDGDQGGGDTNDQTDPPIVLDCKYFWEDRILTKNPKAKVDYVITCMMRSKAEIIIEPGVVIEFEQGYTGILITEEDAPNSSFKAVGTSDKPIIFRGVENEMGYWVGLRFASTNAKNELKHVIVEDAGNQQHNGPNNSGGVYAHGNTSLKMTNTTISNCKNYGLNIVGKRINLTLGNNIITKNEVPLIFEPNLLDKLDPNSIYSGNINDHVNLDTYDNSLKHVQNTTWRKLDVPYRIIGGHRLGVSVDVTIEAGVEVIMSAVSSILVGQQGTLRMNGTAQDKIIFRGIEDVTAYWRSIYFYSSEGALNKMSHVELRNAGKARTNPQNDPNGALLLRGSFLVADNITFTNCFDFAVNQLFDHNGNTNYFEYSNLVLNNTPRLLGDWHNEGL